MNLYLPSCDPEDWKKLLTDPDKQWKKEYSARTLAESWIESGDIPTSVKNVFENSELDLFKEIEILFAFPEYKVSLPPTYGHPSQNDLFLLGKSGEELISIPVEGKVSEPFDKKVAKWLDGSPGKRERLEYICAELGLDLSSVQQIRYQLLHRTVSALIMAKKLNAKNALMMVHSFSECNEGLSDFQQFASIMNVKIGPNEIKRVKTVSGKTLYLAWVIRDKKFLKQ